MKFKIRFLPLLITAGTICLVVRLSQVLFSISNV